MFKIAERDILNILHRLALVELKIIRIPQGYFSLLLLHFLKWHLNFEVSMHSICIWNAEEI